MVTPNVKATGNQLNTHYQNSGSKPQGLLLTLTQGIAEYFQCCNMKCALLSKLVGCFRYIVIGLVADKLRRFYFGIRQCMNNLRASSFEVSG